MMADFGLGRARARFPKIASSHCCWPTVFSAWRQLLQFGDGTIRRGPLRVSRIGVQIRSGERPASAESQLIEALQRMADAASHPGLKDALMRTSSRKCE
jgi:hypothetical protein